MIETQRRRVLDSFAEVLPHHEKGSQWRMTGEARVCQFRDSRAYSAYLKSLRNEGMRFAIQPRRWEATVYVSESDRSKAFDLLQELDRSYPKSERRPVKRRYDVLMWVVTLGLVVLLLLMVGPIRIAIAFLVNWVVVLWLADRAVVSHRWWGRYRFGLLDGLLFVCGLVAMIQILGWKP